MEDALKIVKNIYHQKEEEHINSTTIPIMRRMRLKVQLIRSFEKEGKTISITKTLTALNEVNIHRGSSPNLAHIDCSVNGITLTSAVSDGLLVATPTGSTAYSLSAGGPIVHPSMEGIILTPICPRSLSFRPAMIPSSSKISIKLNPKSRAAIQMSIDGEAPMDVDKDCEIRVTQSSHPIRVICCSDAIDDWVRGINNLLSWNVNFASSTFDKGHGSDQ